MRVLAIDTSTTRIVTGVLDYTGDAIATVAEKSVPGQVSHGELLAPNIQEVLFRTRVTPQELDAVVVGLGPGPYTGLRVGIVTGASMADALKIPAYGVCSLDAVAARSSSAVLVVSDARRKEIYYGVYDGRGERVAGPDVGKPDRVLEDVRRFEVATVLNAGADKYLDQLAELGVPSRRRFRPPRACCARRSGPMLSVPVRSRSRRSTFDVPMRNSLLRRESHETRSGVDDGRDRCAVAGDDAAGRAGGHADGA